MGSVGTGGGDGACAGFTHCSHLSWGGLACAHGRANTAWTVRVLFIEAMPIWFQVRPKSARLIWTSASSHTSPELATGTVAGNRPGAAADCELSGHGNALAGRLEPVNAEDDVGEGVGLEEVARAQVLVPLGVLCLDGRGGHRDHAAHLAHRRDGAVPGDLAERALHRGQTLYAPAPQPDRGLGSVRGPISGERGVGQQFLQRRCGQLS